VVPSGGNYKRIGRNRQHSDRKTSEITERKKKEE